MSTTPLDTTPPTEGAAQTELPESGEVTFAETPPTPDDWQSREEIYQAVEVRYRYLLSLFSQDVSPSGKGFVFSVATTLPLAGSLEDAIDLALLAPDRAAANSVHTHLAELGRVANREAEDAARGPRRQQAGVDFLYLTGPQRKALLLLKDGSRLRPDLSGKVSHNTRVVCGRSDLMVLVDAKLAIQDSRSGVEVFVVSDLGRHWVPDLGDN